MKQEEHRLQREMVFTLHHTIATLNALRKKLFENIVRKYWQLALSPFSHNVFYPFNPLPYTPILGPSNSATNKDMMVKIWTNGDTVI